MNSLNNTTTAANGQNNNSAFNSSGNSGNNPFANNVETTNDPEVVAAMADGNSFSPSHLAVPPSAANRRVSFHDDGNEAPQHDSNNNNHEKNGENILGGGGGQQQPAQQQQHRLSISSEGEGPSSNNNTLNKKPSALQSADLSKSNPLAAPSSSVFAPSNYHHNHNGDAGDALRRPSVGGVPPVRMMSATPNTNLTPPQNNTTIPPVEMSGGGGLRNSVALSTSPSRSSTNTNSTAKILTRSRQSIVAKEKFTHLQREEFRLFLMYIADYMELFFAFEAIDTSGDGKVSLEEFTESVPLLESWGLEIGDPAEQFAAMDESKHGSLNFKDFSDWAIKQHLQIQR